MHHGAVGQPAIAEPAHAAAARPTKVTAPLDRRQLPSLFVAF